MRIEITNQEGYTHLLRDLVAVLSPKALLQISSLRHFALRHVHEDVTDLQNFVQILLPNDGLSVCKDTRARSNAHSIPPLLDLILVASNLDTGFNNTICHISRAFTYLKALAALLQTNY